MAQSTRGKAESMASDTQAAVSDAAAKAQAEMSHQYESTRELLSENSQRLAQQARDMLRSTAEEQKMRAVHGIEGVAKSMHDMARSLHDEQQEIPARYVDMAADQLERGARVLQERGVEDLVSEVETFARRQPALFVGGAFVAGFFLARFLKSTEGDVYRGYEEDYRSSAEYGAGMEGRYGETAPYGGSQPGMTGGGI